MEGWKKRRGSKKFESWMHSYSITLRLHGGGLRVMMMGSGGDSGSGFK